MIQSFQFEDWLIAGLLELSIPLACSLSACVSSSMPICLDLGYVDDVCSPSAYISLLKIQSMYFAFHMVSKHWSLYLTSRGNNTANYDPLSSKREGIGFYPIPFLAAARFHNGLSSYSATFCQAPSSSSPRASCGAAAESP